MATIQIIQGPDRQQSFELNEREIIIGRQGDVQLSDGSTSRHHAKLMRENGRWYISDLGSANGTYVNGTKLTRPTTLNRGDQVRCGATLLVFAEAEEELSDTLDFDERGDRIDAAIVATIPSSHDSVILPSPEAGAAAINRLRILYDLINDISSIFNIDVMLERTLDKVLTTFHADRGYVMLVDVDNNLTLKASRVASGIGPQEIPISRTIINEVVSKQIGILSSNAMGDQRFAAGKSVHDFNIHSAICVPIKGRRRTIGVIHIDSSISEHTYTTEQLRLLTAIGYQTGLALENVELYESAVQSERLAAVGETVAFLSHNIKNILQALDAGVEVVKMALDRGDLDSSRTSWPIIQRNLGRINTLILNMLAFSKEREPLAEPIDVNEIINECIELESPRADERDIALMTDLNELPAIEADAEGIRQVFANLITNAMDAVDDSSGIVTITSQHDTDNECITVRVIDNGHGIASEDLAEIFTPFYSAKGQKGTGLGLAVAKKVVEEHLGNIKAFSRVGEGTTFTVMLPMVHNEGIDPADTDAPQAE